MRITRTLIHSLTADRAWWRIQHLGSTYLQMLERQFFLKDISSVRASSQGAHCCQVPTVPAHTFYNKHSSCGAAGRLFDSITILRQQGKRKNDIYRLSSVKTNHFLVSLVGTSPKICFRLKHLIIVRLNSTRSSRINSV